MEWDPQAPKALELGSKVSTFAICYFFVFHLFHSCSGQVRILTSSDRGDSFSDEEDDGYCFEKTRPPVGRCSLSIELA